MSWFFLLFFIAVVFWDKILLWAPAGLQLANPPVSASQMLRITGVCTMPGSTFGF